MHECNFLRSALRFFKEKIVSATSCAYTLVCGWVCYSCVYVVLFVVLCVYENNLLSMRTIFCHKRTIFGLWGVLFLCVCCIVCSMGWLRLVGSLKLQVSFAEYRLFHRALLQNKPIIERSLLNEAAPYCVSIRMIFRDPLWDFLGNVTEIPCVYVCAYVCVCVSVEVRECVCVRVNLLLCARDKETQRHRDTETQRHRETETQITGAVMNPRAEKFSQ